MLRNKKQNNQMWAMASELKMDKEIISDLAYQFSNSRTTSSRELTTSEFQSLLNHLTAIKAGYTNKQVKPTEQTQSIDNKMRRKILSICHEMNWKENNQLDWKRINAFILKSGYLHKALNSYTEAELPTLVTQFETLLKSYYAKR